MDSIRVVSDFCDVPQKKTLHLAMGIFDGVHLGHQAVLNSAVTTAQKEGGISGLLTFNPHPSKLLRPKEATKLLMPLELKRRMVAENKIDLIICKQFTLDLASLSAEEFLELMKRDMPHLKSLHVGSNFRFGKGRSGDIDFIVSHAKALGIHVFSVDRLKYDGEPISSSRIRKDLSDGNMREVNTLLGYRYFSEGAVIRGRQLGRTLGFPTLNVLWSPETHPKYGVYAVQVKLPKGKYLPAVANYGLRPTVNKKDKTPLLEIHLLGKSCPFKTGDTITAEWVEFIRPEQRFEGIEQLQQQIALDTEAAREILKA
jgi:riboflavin kinase/FMN adenylyltransferase